MKGHKMAGVRITISEVKPRRQKRSAAGCLGNAIGLIIVFFVILGLVMYFAEKAGDPAIEVESPVGDVNTGGN